MNEQSILQIQPVYELAGKESPITIEQTHHFLAGIHHKIEEQKKIAAVTGENFNVFRILGMEASEVHTHSAFLGELLNPKGSHGQGCLFLKVFLALFSKSTDRGSFAQQISGFHAESATLELEKYIGRIDADFTEGGRIDVVLADKFGSQIFIENKIYAGDQKNQLLRYHKHDQKAALVYLTLDGKIPPKSSLAEDAFEVRAISYQKDILEWLIQCRKEVAALPTVREAITQYIELVRFLTHQTASKTMKEEIKKLITKNPDYVDAIQASSQSLDEIILEAVSVFKEHFSKIWADQPIKPIKVNGGLAIIGEWGEDKDGFFIGYRIKDGTTVVKEDSELKRKFANLLHAIDPTFTYDEYNIGWHNPVGFSKKQKVEGLDRKLLVRFYAEKNADQTALDKFTQNIIGQQLKIRNALEESIKTSAYSSL